MSKPRVATLRVNDLLFVNEYLRNDRNATRAYQVVHPKTSYNVAAQRGHVVLKKVEVQKEIALRVQHEAGVTKEFVQSHLLRALDLAGDDALRITTVCRELAELAGLKVHKTEDVTPTVVSTPAQLTEALRARGYAAIN